MPNIFIASLVKSNDCIPQTGISTPFSGPNPQISHLEILGFKPEREENKVNVFTSSSTDSLFSRKNVASSASEVYKKRLSKILRPLMSLLFLTKKIILLKQG